VSTVPVVYPGIARATGSRADSLYVVARAAILFVAQLWSRQLEDRWIRVNAIGPSTGDLPQRSGTALEARGSSTSFSHHLPFVRPNTPSQVAEAVVSLLCDDSCDVRRVQLVVEGDIAATQHAFDRSASRETGRP
jgi:NAD(P)-dependent dehydrogenase (short-subunit alcohol dehydrogenase family)